jgi:quinoprotein glucose dehydrogenase
LDGALARVQLFDSPDGGFDGARYSSNDQVNDGNVSQLQVAWTYSSNDKDTGNRSQIQCNPIVVDGIL